MSDDRSEDDPIMDLWYSNWEQQCVEALESEPDYENQLHNEKEIYSQQMWTKFQTTASAIAQLYKGDPDVPTARAGAPSLVLSFSFPPPPHYATVIPQGRFLPATRISPVSRNIHFVAPLRERRPPLAQRSWDASRDRTRRRSGASFS